MDTKILEDIGLTRLEAKVYLVLLDLGSSLAGKISAVSNMHRRTVYDVLERLVEKGLVRYIKKNNNKWYEPVEPSKLLNFISEKENRLKEAIPQLEAKYSFVKEKQETVFLKGKQALKGIFDDQLNAKEILVLGGSGKADSVVKYYFPRYDSERKRKNIQIRGLYNEKVQIPLSKIKLIPKEFASDVAVNIWNGKIALILWQEDPMAILIKNQKFADGFRKYFELIWKLSK